MMNFFPIDVPAAPFDRFAPGCFEPLEPDRDDGSPRARREPREGASGSDRADLRRALDELREFRMRKDGDDRCERADPDDGRCAGAAGDRDRCVHEGREIGLPHEPRRGV
jgi:hypothetical protein